MKDPAHVKRAPRHLRALRRTASFHPVLSGPTLGPHLFKVTKPQFRIKKKKKKKVSGFL